MKMKTDHKILIPILVIIILFSPGFAQSSSEVIPAGSDAWNNTPFTDSISDLNRFSMNHALTFMASSGNGFSGSMGIYSNYMNYHINEKMNVQAGIHLIRPSISTGFGEQPSLDLDYDLQFNYRFSDNARFQLNLIKMNSNSVMNQNMYSKPY